MISVSSSNELMYPQEFLDSLNLSDLPPHILQLKVGAIVILLHNINVIIWLINGTKLVVKRMYKNYLDLEIITGLAKGRRVLPLRLDITSSDTTLPFKFKRRQFPVCLAFVITINKF